MHAVLDRAYADLVALVGRLSDEQAWAATGCLGWTVRDLTFHLLGDAQRALVALATPEDAQPDRDAVTYWRDAPGEDDPDFQGLRATRTVASAWRWSQLRRTYVETAAAVLTAAGRAAPTDLVRTQGHRLRVDDLLATLTVEATVHHLDLVHHLDANGPADDPLDLTRLILVGLWKRPPLRNWDTVTFVRKATGRSPLTESERTALGDAGGRLPLIS